MKKIYNPPLFWATEAPNYNTWLSQKANTHYKRDCLNQKICQDGVAVSDYRDAIHDAITRSKGVDYYTGEQLEWGKIGHYKNEKIHYLPTIDHAFEQNQIKFEICSWRTNDAKNDLNMNDFKNLCANVLRYAGYQIIEPLSAPVAPFETTSTAETP